MQRNIKLTIEYEGTQFKGWQIQPKGQRTVQSEITKACEKLFGHKIKLIGSGRTDTGVHALGQAANFHTNSTIPLGNITKALNTYLPNDIVILNAEDMNKDFHAQYSAKSKTYRYTILNREAPSALMRNHALHYPYKLNLSRMRNEAKCLLGKKDFKSFQAADPSKKREDTIRTIKRLEIKKKKDVITIEIESNGFLYKMVRNIVGTLLEISSGIIPKKSITDILHQKDRSHAGTTAKAHGLCLLKVGY